MAAGVWGCVDSGVLVVVGTLISWTGGGGAGSYGSAMSSLVLKMVASCSKAVVCSGPNVGKGEAGDGFRMVWMRSVIAWMALSQLDSFSIGATCGKNSTVLAMQILPLDGMWHW